MFFRISQYTPKQTEDECGNEDRGVYSLIFGIQRTNTKSQKMSHKEELVKKCSLEYHNTPQIKYLRI